MDACQLTEKHCQPCEGGVPPLTAEEVAAHVAATPAWEVRDGRMIERKWKFRNFVEAMRFLQRVGELAEAEQHHPDLHLTGYRHVTVALTTHAIGGLSENDFIVAAKLDQLVDRDAS